MRTTWRCSLGTNAKERKKIRRVTFNEITKKAVQEAFKHARDMDQNLVDAQQTRRVLDRLVGYQISPLLWDKVRRGLVGRPRADGGRAADRRAGAGDWRVSARSSTGRSTRCSIRKSRRTRASRRGLSASTASRRALRTARTRTAKTQFIATRLPDKKSMDAVVAALEKAKWSLASVQSHRAAAAAAGALHHQPVAAGRGRASWASTCAAPWAWRSGSMKAWISAQRARWASSLTCVPIRRAWRRRRLPAAREWIGKQLGAKYLPASPNVYKGKKDAQDAHEAIRPTDASRTPESIARYLTDEQLKLYTAHLAAVCGLADGAGGLRRDHGEDCSRVSPRQGRPTTSALSGSVVRFDGFLKVYEVSEDKKDEDDESANKLPNLDNVKTLELEKLDPEQHFTQPPPRYNEASLVKELEERGIGRPSTYASIINTIQDREYVVKQADRAGASIPPRSAMVVCDLLVKNFPYIFDTAYTAKLESELDDIEEGKEKWTDLLNGFYGHFEDELKDAGKKMEDIKRMEKKTDEKCDVCGSPLLLKWGKFGSFYACSAYNKKDPTSCTFTKENTAAKPDLNTPEAQEAGEQRGVLRELRPVMVLRRGPFGLFMACPGLQRRSALQDLPQAEPEAAAEAAAPKPTGEDCPHVRQAAGAAPGQRTASLSPAPAIPSAST